MKFINVSTDVNVVPATPVVMTSAVVRMTVDSGSDVIPAVAVVDSSGVVITVDNIIDVAFVVFAVDVVIGDAVGDFDVVDVLSDWKHCGRKRKRRYT